MTTTTTTTKNANNYCICLDRGAAGRESLSQSTKGLGQSLETNYRHGTSKSELGLSLFLLTLSRDFVLFSFSVFFYANCERGGASGKSVASSCCCCRRCCCLFVACNRKRVSHSGWHLKLQRRSRAGRATRYKCSHVTARCTACASCSAAASACASCAAAVAPHVGLHFTRHAAAPCVFPPCKQSAAGSLPVSASPLSRSPALLLSFLVFRHWQHRAHRAAPCSAPRVASRVAPRVAGECR